MSRQTVLMTGALGDIGRRIRPLMRHCCAFRAADLKPVEDEEDSHIADITDLSQLVALMDGVDAIMHMAIAPSRDYPNEDDLARARLDVNVKGTYNVLEAAREGPERVEDFGAPLRLGVRRRRGEDGLRGPGAGIPDSGLRVRDPSESQDTHEEDHRGLHRCLRHERAAVPIIRRTVPGGSKQPFRLRRFARAGGIEPCEERP